MDGVAKPLLIGSSRSIPSKAGGNSSSSTREAQPNLVLRAWESGRRDRLMFECWDGGDLNACKVVEASRNMFDIFAPCPGLATKRERSGTCLLFLALFGGAAFCGIFVKVARFAARL